MFKKERKTFRLIKFQPVLEIDSFMGNCFSSKKRGHSIKKKYHGDRLNSCDPSTTATASIKSNKSPIMSLMQQPHSPDSLQSQSPDYYDLEYERLHLFREQKMKNKQEKEEEPKKKQSQLHSQYNNNVKRIDTSNLICLLLLLYNKLINPNLSFFQIQILFLNLNPMFMKHIQPRSPQMRTVHCIIIHHHVHQHQHIFFLLNDSFQVSYLLYLQSMQHQMLVVVVPVLVV